MKRLVTLAILGVLAWQGYSQYEAYRTGQGSEEHEDTGEFVTDSNVEPTSQFTCDGRTHCSEMSSCAEATFFVQHCPGTKMDGDGDGVPCEQQFCR